MKVILLADLPKVGRKYEVKEVASGYARNVLIKSNKALPATPENLKKISTKKQILDKETKHQEIVATEIATSLKDQVVTITLPAGDKSQLFSALHKKDTTEAIKKNLSLTVDPEDVSWDGQIKKTGQFPAVFSKAGQRVSFILNIEAD